MIYFLQVIFPYIVLFYLIDCFVYVKSYQIIFYSHFGKKYKSAKKGIRFIGISPFCRVFNASNFPFYLTDSGIYMWKRDHFAENDLFDQKNFDLITYEEIEKCESDGNLLVLNGNRKLYFNSYHAADYFRKNIDELIKHPKKIRQQFVNEFYEKPEPVNQIMAHHQSPFLTIQFLGTLLFIYTFLLLPSVLFLGLPLKLNVLLIIIAVCYVFTIGLSFYAHKKICKSREKKFLFLLSMIFSPVSAIHALHLITRDIVLSLDWLIPASSLLSPDIFKPQLIKELKRIYFSKKNNNGSNLDSFLAFKEKIYLALLDEAGLKQSDIFLPPERKDSVAHSFCPMCDAEFMKGIEKCPDCDIALKEYDGTPIEKE